MAVPFACWSLRAQDTLRAAPDTTPAAAAAAAASPLQGPAQLPATHTVARGETLWSISQLYFSDPMLWPEIYRLNTGTIEDPHWIYPGEVLTISGPEGLAQVRTPAETTAVSVAPPVAGGDTVRAQVVPTDTAAALVGAPTDTAPPTTPEEPPPPPADEAYQTIFDRPRSRTAEVQDVLRAYLNQPYRPLRRGEFYSAGFLSEGEHLPWGRVVGATAKPAIPRLTDRSTAYQFERIVVEPPSSVSYHVGDSILIARIDRQEGEWGDVVVPVGVARVREVARRQLLADVVLQFGAVHGGQLALPLEPFKDPGEVRPTPIDDGLRGHVINERDLHTLSLTQQVIFIDRGRADGVMTGDVFEAYTGQVGTPSKERHVLLEIVHTREHSSSGLILTIDNPQVYPGLPARLVRKMPS